MFNIIASVLLLLGLNVPHSQPVTPHFVQTAEYPDIPDSAFADAQPTKKPKEEPHLKGIRLVRCGDTHVHWFGTMVHIGPNRYMTAYHVIENAICYDAATFTKLKIVHQDPDNDFALLESPTELDNSILKISCKRFVAGKVYHSVGWAGGESLTSLKIKATGMHTSSLFIVDGKVEEHMRVFSGPMIPGMSGGSVIDDDWTIHGMNNATSEKESYSRELADTVLCK